ELQTLDLFLLVAQLRLQTFDLDRKAAGSGVEPRGRVGQQRFAQCETFVSVLAGDGLNAARARSDRGVGDDFEDADVARGVDVRAAAKLGRKPRHAHHAHAVAVLLAEERHRAAGQGLVQRLLLFRDCRVLERLVVDEALDLRDLFLRQRREVREVEAQAVGRDQRAGLFDVRPQNLAQRRGQPGRRRVIGHGPRAFFGVYMSVDRVAGLQGALFDRNAVNGHARGRRIGVGHQRTRVFVFEHANVADLSARFGVKRRAIQNDLGLIARYDLTDQFAVFD